MGKVKSQQVVALSTDASGAAKFDSILGTTDRFVKSTHQDLVPAARAGVSLAQLARPDELAVAELTAKTQAAINKKLGSHSLATAPLASAHAAARSAAGETSYVQYTPAAGDGSRGTTRIVKLVTQAVDPLEPPKFRHKKVTKGEAEAPVPVLHSPPRKVTVEDQEAWKIPPAISNWKNKNGLAIPLDKRLLADGRNLQEVAISDNFAKVQALYIAEEAAREEVRKRAAIQEKIAMNEKEQHEEKLHQLARHARIQRTGGPAAAAAPSRADDAAAGAHHHHDDDDDDGSASASSGSPRGDGGSRRHDDPEKAERDRIRAERRRERERQSRMEMMGNRRGKLTRDAERDVSERIALGMQVASAGGAAGEVQFDQRLFNHGSGVKGGFGGEDEYNVYDAPLLKRGELASHVYRPKEVKDFASTEAEQDAAYDSLLKTDKFRQSASGSRASEAATARDGPVQFEKETEADPFGLDSFLQSAKEAQSSSSSTNAGERKRTRGDDGHGDDRSKRR